MFRLSWLKYVTCLLAILAPVVSARLESQIMIVFLFLALFVGAVVTFLLSRYAPGLPYTVVVFACGAGLAIMFAPVDKHDVLKESERLWNNIEPELVLFMFLPALLFGEAMSLNFHHVRGAFIPASVLAGPGALFGAFLMAVLAKYLLPYNWEWSLCFLFGCILCATDPVGTFYIFLVSFCFYCVKIY
jgi:NhaP-type Na+/H+ or K+/H+ antiporter